VTRFLRSWLFTPGDNPRHLSKLTSKVCDASLIDLEDSVISSRKTEAHRQVESLLDDRPRTHPIWVRTNPFGSIWFNDDIACAIAADGICLPKVETPEQISEVDALLEHHERRIGKARGSTSLLIAIESPESLVNVNAIVKCNPRINGLLFGAEDYALALGLPQLESGTTDALTYAQCRIVLAAKAAGIQVIDGVYTDVSDTDGQRAHCVRARALGFTGVAAIHPSQVQVIDDVFKPTAKAIEEARRITSTYETALLQNKGVTTLDGMMIDYPIAARAARMLAEQGLGEPPPWLVKTN
jgi:citrate lyase subunit beta/citryl-CoA lyase